MQFRNTRNGPLNQQTFYVAKQYQYSLLFESKCSNEVFLSMNWNKREWSCNEARVFWNIKVIFIKYEFVIMTFDAEQCQVWYSILECCYYTIYAYKSLSILLDKVIYRIGARTYLSSLVDVLWLISGRTKFWYKLCLTWL